MMDKPKGFSLAYLFKGDGIKDWWKALGALWRIVVIIALLVLLLAGIAQIRALFWPQTGDNVHRPTFIALPGSTVGAVDLHSEQKQEQKKRAWWVPIPYVYGEASVRSRTDKGTINFGSYDPGVEVGAGVRWDLW